MKGVDQSILGIDNLGNAMMMHPGQELQFPGSMVMEIPVGYHQMPDGSLMRNEEMQLGGTSAESTGVFVDINKFKGREFLPKKVKDTASKKVLTVAEKQNRLEQLNRELEERDYAQYVLGTENPSTYNKVSSLIDPTGFMDLNSIVEQGIRNETFDPTDAAGAIGSLIPGSTGFKALKLFLNTAGKAGDVADAANEQYNQGGQNMKMPNNKGFSHLPEYVQKHILANMKAKGGQSNYPVFMQTGGGFNVIGNASLANRGEIDKTLTRSDITLNTSFEDIDPNANVAGINALFEYAKSKGISTAALNTNAGLKNVGLKTIQEFNQGNPTMQVTPDQIGLLQKYHNKTDPRIAMDDLYGSETSRLYYPIRKSPPPPEPSNYGFLRQWASGNPGAGSFQTYNKPDPTGDFGSKLTTYAVDNDTGQLIDSSKSYDPSGKYTPSFIPESDPRWTNPKGQLFPKESSIWEHNTNTGGFEKATKASAQEIDAYKSMLQQQKQAIKGQYGGSPFESNRLNKFMTNYFKKLGGGAQGESIDEVVSQKNTDFVNYIANNTKAAMFKNEITNFQNNFKQIGGQKNEDQSLIEGQTDYMSGSQDQFNGAVTNQFVPAPKEQRFGMYGKFDEWNKLGIDPNLAQYNYDMQDRLAETEPKNNEIDFDGNQFADIAMVGMQGINSLFNNYRANLQNKLNRDKMTIENTAGTSYGSRGDYDVNQGNFRPNQKVTPSYQFGGGSGYQVPHNIAGKNYTGIPMNQLGHPLEFTPEASQFKPDPYVGYEGYDTESDWGISSGGGPSLSVTPFFKKGGSKNIYKKGGQYSVDQKEIQRLISEGYDFEILD